MKIVLVSANYPPKIGGPASSVPALARRLAARGHRVEVVALRFPGYPRFAVKEGVRVHRAFNLCRDPHANALHHNLLNAAALAWETARILKRGDVDVVHAHDFNLSALAAVGARALARRPVPVLAKFIGDLSLEYRFNYARLSLDEIYGPPPAGGVAGALERVEKWLAGQVDGIVTVGAYQKRHLKAKGVPGEKIAVVRNALDLERFAPAPLPRNNPPVLLFYGRVVYWKGLEVLLEALHLYLRGGGQARLRIVGAGPMLGELKARARVLGIEERVAFVGSVPREEVLSEIARANAVAVPSLYDNFPFQMMEAMAMARPLVASRVCAVPEAVRHEKEALLVPPGDGEALAEAIARVLEDRSLAERLARAARARAKALFSWDRHLRELEALYAACAQRRGRGGGRGQSRRPRPG